MPQPYNTVVLTDSGSELAARVNAGECRIEFTKVSTGDGVYEDKSEAYLRGLATLKSPKNDFAVASALAYNNMTARVSVDIKNYDSEENSLVDESYNITEIGLFAKDSMAGSEVLYCIAIADDIGELLPAYRSAPIHLMENFYISISNAETAIVKSGGVYVTIEDMENMKSNTDQAIADAVRSLTMQTLTVTVDKDSWAGLSAPYTQTVVVPGIKSTSDMMLVSTLEDGASLDVQKAYNKAFGIISSGTITAAEDEVIFKVYKRTTTTIVVGLHGIL